MFVITCDNCKRRKSAQEKREWILCFNVEANSLEKVRRAAVLDVAGLELLRAEERVRSTRAGRSGRTLIVNNRWDERRIAQQGAVHLCSSKCKNEYVKKLSKRQAA
jgi:hypothetical protein